MKPPAPLSLLETRVLGVLVEKEKTVPETYPLSLNALTLGCNQKNNRDPVLAAGEGEVLAAIDALKAQGDARVVRLTAARHDDAWIRLCVVDEGPGVAPELTDTLFRPLVTSKTSGLGLGLAISRTIVEAHGGRVEAHSEGRGQGSTFTVVLPAA